MIVVVLIIAWSSINCSWSIFVFLFLLTIITFLWKTIYGWLREGSSSSLNINTFKRMKGARVVIVFSFLHSSSSSGRVIKWFLSYRRRKTIINIFFSLSFTFALLTIWTFNFERKAVFERKNSSREEKKTTLEVVEN